VQQHDKGKPGFSAPVGMSHQLPDPTVPPGLSQSIVHKRCMKVRPVICGHTAADVGWIFPSAYASARPIGSICGSVGNSDILHGAGAGGDSSSLEEEQGSRQRCHQCKAKGNSDILHGAGAGGNSSSLEEEKGSRQRCHQCKAKGNVVTIITHDSKFYCKT